MTTLNDTFKRELTQKDKHHLVFTSSDNESPVRTSDPYLQHLRAPDDSPLQGRVEPPSQPHHHMDYHHTSTPSTDNSFQDATTEEEEDFPTAPLDDDIWLEEPVLDRHLCIHEQSQPHYQCSYPCPYSFDLLQSASEDAPAPYYKMMDLSDISDLQYVMTTTSLLFIPTFILLELSPHELMKNCVKPNGYVNHKCMDIFVGMFINAETLLECYEHVLECYKMHKHNRNIINRPCWNIYN